MSPQDISNNLEELAKKPDKEAPDGKKNVEPAVAIVSVEAIKVKPGQEPSDKKKKGHFHRLRSDEHQYYTACCQNLLRENLLLLAIALLLSMAGILGQGLFFNIKGVLYNLDGTIRFFFYIAFFFLAVSTACFLGVAFLSIIVNNLFSRFAVLANQETRLGDKRHLLALFSDAYACFQASKMLSGAGIGATLCFVVIYMLHQSVLLGLALLIALIGLAGLAYFYASSIQKNANKVARKPIPLLEDEVANIFPGSVPREIEEKPDVPDVDEKIQIASLMAILQSRVPKIRKEAVKLLGRLATPDTLNAVIPMLGDTVSEVRAQAIAVLGKSGEKSMREPLRCMLYDDNADVRAAVVEAIGNLGDDDAFDLIVQALDDAAPEVRGAAAEALANLGIKKAVKYIVAKMKDKDWFVRHKAVIALGKVKTELPLDAIENLLQAARDEHNYVNSSARHLLKKLVVEMSQKDPICEEIRQFLDKVANDERVTSESAKPVSLNRQETAAASSQPETNTADTSTIGSSPITLHLPDVVIPVTPAATGNSKGTAANTSASDD